jgi:ATP-binding protein involved in chromosome partitioning
MVDPRTSVIHARMKAIRNIIAVSGGKGGVGKSLFASVFALTLAEKGSTVGLFDLDFTSPSTHRILGVEGLQPTEEKGIVPPLVDGLKYMSITYYSGDEATPMRGMDFSNALTELLATVKWGRLDCLVLDMPPGIGDATLDLLRLLNDVKFLIVTTPSQLAFETVRKLNALLETSKTPVIGIVENMKMNATSKGREQARELGVPFLGDIPYDKKVEDAIGNRETLLRTNFAEKVMEIASNIKCQ